MAAAAIGIAVIRGALSGISTPVDPTDVLRRDLVHAAGAQRLFLPRLVGGFAHGRPAVQRSAERKRVDTSPALRIAAARLEESARHELNATSLNGLGVARLVTGDATGAVQALEAASRAQEDPRLLTDLAAAYLVRFERDQRFDDLARALDAASQAFARQPTLHEAAFNRALALELTGLEVQARAAWRDYLASDRESNWATEARERLAALEQPSTNWEVWRAQAGITPAGSISSLTAEEAARRFAQPAREWLERDAAEAWAEAARAGDAARRDAVLRTAAALAAALYQRSGDRMALDVTREYASTRDRATLASAHIDYVQGVRLYRRHERAAAARYFARAEAAFRRTGSVQWMWASVQRAILDYHRRDIPAARVRLAAVSTAANQHPYAILQARIAWLLGFCETQDGRLAQAVAFYRQAAPMFERAGEVENAGYVYNTWAHTLRILGEYQSGWQRLGQALRLSPSFEEPIRRYVVLFNASLYALREGLLGASLAFENGAVEQAALDRESPAAQVEARLRRAALLGRLQRGAEAEADLTAAHTLSAGVKDAAQAAFFRATQQAIEAEVFAERADAVARADAALPVLKKAEPSDVPRLLLARSRAFSAHQQWSDAEASLEMGVHAFELMRRQLNTADDRIAYLDHGVELYRELASVRVRRGAEAAVVFDAVERGRARTLFEDIAGMATPISSTVDVRRRLPPQTAVVVYSVLPDRLLTWLLTPERERFFDVPLRATDIAREVETVRTVLDLDATDREISQFTKTLSEWLIAPWLNDVPEGWTLVVVPDSSLHRVPFAMLRGSDGRYTIERHAIVVAPSASLFVLDAPSSGRGESRDQSRAGTRDRFDVSGHAKRADTAAEIVRRPLFVGSPLASGDMASALPALPETVREVREIAGLYSRPMVLMGRESTLARLREQLPHASLFHFAGHAVMDPYAPQVSRLVVTPEEGLPDTAGFYASEIAALDLRHVDVVVLSACSTAAGTLRSGEGVLSIARAFLAAGVPTVLATQWKIEDSSARIAFAHVHHRLRDGASPAQALRAAQLAMLASDDPIVRHPRQWAGLVAIGIRAQGDHTSRLTTSNQRKGAS